MESIERNSFEIKNGFASDRQTSHLSFDDIGTNMVFGHHLLGFGEIYLVDFQNHFD